MFEWNDDNTKTTVEMWKGGASAQLIANRIGNPSRNSVIGKLHRLGLAQGDKAGQKSVTYVRRSPARPPKPRVSTITGRLSYQGPPKPRPEPLPPVHVDDVARVSAVADLEPHHCRYPIGDPQSPDFGFCGHAAMPGSVYCQGHHARCWHPATPKRVKDHGQPAHFIAVHVGSKIAEPA